MTRYIPILLCTGLLLATAGVSYAMDPAAAEVVAPGIGTSPIDQPTGDLVSRFLDKAMTGAYWAALGLIVILGVKYTRKRLGGWLASLFGSDMGGLVYAGLVAGVVAFFEALAQGERPSWALAATAVKLAVGAVVGYHALTEKPALGGAVGKAVKG